MPPAEGERGDALPSCLKAHTASKSPFHSLLSDILSAFFVLFWVISQLKMAPKCRAEVLVVVLRARRLCWVLQRKYALDQLHSGISYTAMTHGSNVSQSTACFK